MGVVVSALLGLGVILVAPDDPVATADDPPPQPAAPQCRDQQPQDFLIRGNYVARGKLTPAQRRERQAIHQKAIRYRTEQYGYFAPYGNREWNAHPPSHYAKQLRFMGLNVRLNERIHPAVQCAEAEIHRTCSPVRYRPRRLSGIRFQNTYHTGEITNHVYGIALDIDPHLNTCCGCIAKWAAHPLCQKRVRSIFERMAMPECWVRAFQRYGFYWLGDDQLRDTMHFEFLADPDQILAPQ